MKINCNYVYGSDKYPIIFKIYTAVDFCYKTFFMCKKKSKSSKNILYNEKFQKIGNQ